MSPRILPQAPTKLQDEKLYAKLYHAYLRTCQTIMSAETSPPNSGAHPTGRTNKPWRAGSYVPEPKDSSVERVQTKGIPSVCRICRKEFPSRSSMFRHLNFHEKSKPQLALYNEQNDPTDDDTPFVALSTISKKGALLKTIEEGRTETGLLPTGFLDTLIRSDPNDDLFCSFEAPPGNTDRVPGDLVPKKQKLKSYVLEAAKAKQDQFQEDFGYVLDNDMIEQQQLATRQFGSILRHAVPSTSRQVIQAAHTNLSRLIEEEDTTSTQAHKVQKNFEGVYGNKFPTSATFATDDSDDDILLGPSYTEEDTQTREDDDLFGSDTEESVSGEPAPIPRLRRCEICYALLEDEVTGTRCIDHRL